MKYLYFYQKAYLTFVLQIFIFSIGDNLQEINLFSGKIFEKYHHFVICGMFPEGGKVEWLSKPKTRILTLYCILSSVFQKTHSNSLDPDQMPQTAASEQGLHHWQL